MVLLKVELSSI